MVFQPWTFTYGAEQVEKVAVTMLVVVRRNRTPLLPPHA